jgi:hypothetical protein
MYDTINLVDTIKKGAEGDVLAAVEACKTIVDEKIFNLVPAQSHTPRSYPVNNPNDKGKKMVSTKESLCKTCNETIHTGEDIYFKRSAGAVHVSCIDTEEKPPF